MSNAQQPLERYRQEIATMKATEALHRKMLNTEPYKLTLLGVAAGAALTTAFFTVLRYIETMMQATHGNPPPGM